MKLNSVLLEGVLVNNPSETDGAYRFQIDSDGLMVTITLKDKLVTQSSLYRLRKGEEVRVVGRLREDGILAEHVEIRVIKEDALGEF